MKYLIAVSLLLLLLISGCSKEELFSEQSRHDLWLIHEDAKLPIVVEGNTLSKVFVILLHGGPGGSAQEFNASGKPFTDELEEDYAMVYYDQRNAGLSIGEWEEEKLTIEQHVEDLEKVIDLLRHHYSDDIQIFLTGHSWGGYLGSAFLLDTERQLKVKAWINIDGQIHRNRNILDILERIESIGAEQISNSVNATAWEAILDEVDLEKAKSITQYDVDAENNVFALIRAAERQIDRDGVLEYRASSVTPSIYSDNYDPFRIVITNTGDRDISLRRQMYSFDAVMDTDLGNINLPSLSIYGYFDVNTPLHQGEYFIDKIGTLENDKALVILDKSGHSSMLNEPVALANEMKIWIEKYR